MNGSKYFVYRNALARKIAKYLYEKAMNSKSNTITVNFDEIEKVFNINLIHDLGLRQSVDEYLYEYPEVADTQVDKNSITIWILIF